MSRWLTSVWQLSEPRMMPPAQEAEEGDHFRLTVERMLHDLHSGGGIAGARTGR